MSPQKENELILFGGEWYDGERDRTHVYADLFVLDVEKVAWRRIVSPKGPLPRSSHQSVMTKYHMYVFGGEFTSLNQEKFRHYKWVQGEDERRMVLVESGHGACQLR